jgi:hypothetical protein
MSLKTFSGGSVITEGFWIDNYIYWTTLQLVTLFEITITHRIMALVTLLKAASKGGRSSADVPANLIIYSLISGFGFSFIHLLASRTDGLPTASLQPHLSNLHEL